MNPTDPSTPDWVRFLSSTAVFLGIPEVALKDLSARMEEVVFHAGETLIRQGESGDCMFLIVSGQVQVVREAGGEERVLAELGPGRPVGELALWTGDLRTATVRALTETRAVKLTREEFDDFSKKHPEAIPAVDAFVAAQVRRNQLSVALRVSKMFGELDPAAMRELEDALEPEWVESGRTLFRQGDVGDALYLVVSGRLRVLVEKEGAVPHVVAEFGRGETVGEMALLEGEARSATVIASRDSQVARLSREAFERLVSGRTALLMVIARMLVKRLRAQNTPGAHTAPTVTVIAVVPGTPGFPLDEFCTQLADAFSSHGKTLLLGSARMDTLMGKAGAAQTTEHEAAHGRIMDLLSKLEAEHRYVIYQADPTDSPWTHRCVRQCDQVLTAVDASADPKAGSGFDVGPMLGAGTGRRSNLVLVHRKPDAIPSGTMAWFAGRKVDQHYHLRLESRIDFARVARSLTGRGIGLVLGGGAARGLGHAGVIKALQEAGIPIDLVGGTSMGSIMGALLALEYDHDRMLKTNLENCAAVVKDKTIPLVAFLTGHGTNRVIHRTLGDTQIEDLWLPYFCISANLTRARFEVHKQGPLVKSILASTRMPGIFPPIVWDGDLLVDGGIINNVPVDVMRANPAVGTVIASDVSPAYDPSGVSDYGHGISGWKVLRQRFRPLAKRERFPSISSVLLRSMDFGGAAHRSQTMGAADLYLAPPLARFQLKEFERAVEMAEVSYQYSVPKIAAWLAASPAIV